MANRNNGYYSKTYTIEELMAERKKLVKEANKRIRRLTRTFSPIDKRRLSTLSTGAYAVIAKPYIGKGKTYFSRKPSSTDKDALRHELSVVSGFLSAQTSEAEEFTGILSRRAETFIKRYHVPHDIAYSSEFYDFLDSAAFENAVRRYPNSGDIVDTIARNMSDKSGMDDLLNAFNEWASESRLSKKSLIKIAKKHGGKGGK